MHAAVNGTRLYFDIDGAGTAWDDTSSGRQRPVLLLLPGGPGSSHLTYKNPIYGFDVLTRVFQVVYVDWRGAGASEPAPPDTLTLAQAVQDAEALRIHLGIEDWIVMGASAGGIWALAYAATHPQRTNLLLAFHCAASGASFADMAECNARRAGVTDSEAIQLYRDFAGGALTGDVRDWAASLRSTIIQTQQALYMDAEQHPDAVEDHQRRWDTQPDLEMLAELDAARWYLRDMALNYRVEELGPAIHCPAFISTGAGDPVAPPAHAQFIADALPDAELYVHNGRHLPLDEERTEFWARIADFLVRHSVDAAGLVLPTE